VGFASNALGTINLVKKLVHIICAPIACKEGFKDSWREVAAWSAGHLKARFGKVVQVKYFDLFAANCPPVPAGAQLPLVNTLSPPFIPSKFCRKRFAPIVKMMYL
jgi:hypothetical protein